MLICISSVRQIPSDRLTYIFRSQILKEQFIADSNKIEIVEFTQESVFMGRKPCGELESEFGV